MQITVNKQVRRMIKVCLLVLLPIALLGAVQGYYWYQAKTGVDKLITALKPVARIEYSTLNAWLLQPISLQSVNVRLPSGSVVMTVDEWSFTLSDWQSYLSLDSALSSGQLTHPVSMSLANAKVSLASILRMRDAQEDSDGYQRADFSTLVCGDQTQRKASDLLSLGYSFISGSVDLSIEPSTQNKALHLAINSQWQQFMDMNLDVLVGQPTGVSLRREALGSSLVQRFKLDVQDRGFNNRWSIHCRKQSGIEEGNLYWEAYEAALNEWWRELGVPADLELNQALVNAHMPNAKVQFAYEPAKPVKLLDLTDHALSESLINRSEIHIHVGNDTVELTDQQWLALQSVYAGGIQNAVHVMVTGEQREQPEPEPEPQREVVPGVIPIQPALIEKSFKATQVEVLSDYIGSAIKVETRFSGPIEGVLVSVSEKAINVRRHIEQGRATVPVMKASIGEIQVYR